MVIGFVACCGRKLSHAAPAQDLYQSDLFKKSRAHVEARCDRWYILSAKWGIVVPSAVIEPYDVTLNRMTVSERKAWTRSVREKLFLFRSHDLLVLAGKRYREPFEGIRHEAPLKGLGIGQQLAWLKEVTG